MRNAQLSLYPNSVQFSHSVLYDSLQSNGLQHARLPCPSLTPELAQIHVHRVVNASQPSHFLLSFSPCLQSLAAPVSFPMSWLLTSDGHSIRASASVLPMNIQG